MTARCKTRIRTLARKASVKLATRNIDGGYVWDGETIALLEANNSPRSDANIVHDIAHYLVAPATRRKHPEFGLGTSSDAGVPSINSLLTHEYAQREEEEASLLGILIEKELKLDPEGTFGDHMWCVYEEADSLVNLLRNFRKGKRNSIGLKALRRLHRKGHIDARLKPKVLA